MVHEEDVLKIYRECGGSPDLIGMPEEALFTMIHNALKMRAAAMAQVSTQKMPSSMSLTEKDAAVASIIEDIREDFDHAIARAKESYRVLKGT
ncbi:MAG: hypothetical protein AAB805_01615 [Patescibacteria group bacterium]